MNKFAILLSLFAASMSVPAYAEEPAKTSVSVEDVRQLAEQVKALKEVVNGEVPKPATAEKTMADVSDKALDMLGGAVGTVSETLKKIGPEVWRIMIRQQYASAAQQIVGPFLALLASIIALLAFRKSLTRQKEDSYDMDAFKIIGRVILCLVPCICALIVAVQSSDAVAILINPEYYALKDLLGLMTGK